LKNWVLWAILAALSAWNDEFEVYAGETLAPHANVR
jgi:hypothetical protein